MGGQGGNIGGANFEITGSEGSPSVGDVLKNQIDAVKRATREFGKPIQFFDPKSGDLIVQSVSSAIGSLKSLKSELASIDKVGAGVHLLPDVASLRDRTVEAIKAVTDQLGKLKQAGDEAFTIPDVSRAQQAIQNLGKTQEAAAKRLEAETQARGKQQSAAEKLDAAQIQAAGKLQSAAEKLDAVQTQAEGKRISAAEKINAKLAEQAASQARLAGLGIPSVSKDDAAIQKHQTVVVRALNEEAAAAVRAQKAQEALSKSSAAAINAQNPQAFKARTAAYQAQFLAASKLTKETEKATIATSGIGKAFARADQFLAGFGLNVRGISVLLGAGIAGGFAGVVRIGEKVIQVFSSIIGAEIELQRQTELTFGATNKISEFARQQSSVFGSSRDAIQGAANSYGVFAIQLGLVGDAVTQFGESFAALADVVTRTVPGVAGLSEAQALIKSAISGNIEAFHQLGFTTTEVNRIAQEEFGKTVDQLDDLQRAAILAGNGIDQLSDKAKNVKLDPTIELGHRVFDEFKHAVTAAFGAVEKLAIATAVQIFQVFEAMANTVNFFLNGLIEDYNILIRALNHIPGLDASEVPKIPIIHIPDLIPGLDGVDRALDDNAKHLKVNQKAVEDLTAAEKAKRQEDFLTSTQLQTQALDAIQAVTNAEIEGARRVEEAQIRLQRVREDNARKVFEANLSLTRAFQDRNKAIFDANLKLAEAEEARRRSIGDARRNLAEAQLQSFRSIRDAEERLNKAHIDETRKILDLERRLADARRQQAFDIVSSFRAVEDAQNSSDIQAERSAAFALSQARRGGAVKDAQGSLTQEQADSRTNIARLERDLAETRVDAAKKVQDAQRTLTRAIVDGDARVAASKRDLAQTFVTEDRKIEDAQRRLAEVEVENNRALFDAKKNLLDVQLQTNKAVQDAITAQEQLNITLGLTVEEIQTLLDSITARNLSTFKTLSAFHFAEGGNISKNQVSWVGERGPELFIPSSNGQIVNNRDLIKALRGMKGGDSGSPTINVYEAHRDPEEIAFAVMARMAAESRR